jgi:hypothetical protein
MSTLIDGFSSTLASFGFGNNGRRPGPYKASDGDFFYFGGGVLTAYKSAAGVTGWDTATAATALDSPNYQPSTDALSCAQDGDTIHCFWWSLIDSRLDHIEFDMAAETWGAWESIVDVGSAVWMANATRLGACVLPDASTPKLCVFFEGDSPKIMGTNYARLYVAHRNLSGGAWTVTVLPGQSGENHWDHPMIAPGVGDSAAVVYRDGSLANNPVRIRLFDAVAASFTAEQSASDAPAAERPIEVFSYNSGSEGRPRVVTAENIGSVPNVYSFHEDGSVLTFDNVQNGTTSANDVSDCMGLHSSPDDQEYILIEDVASDWRLLERAAGTGAWTESLEDSGFSNPEKLGLAVIVRSGSTFLDFIASQATGINAPEYREIRELVVSGLSPAPVPSEEAFGRPALTVGAVTLSPAPVPSEEAFAAPTLAFGAVTLAAESVPTEENLEAPTLLPGAVFLSAGGIPSEENLPAPTLTPGAIGVLANPIPSEENLPAPEVTISVAPGSIPSEEALPAPSLTLGPVGLSPAPLPSEENLPAPLLSLNIEPAPVPSEEAFGQPTLTVGAVTLSPAPVPSEEAFGQPTVTAGAVNLSPAPVPSEEAFGQATLTTGPPTVAPFPIRSEENLPAPALTVGPVTLSPAPIPSDESLPPPSVLSGAVNLSPEPIGSEENLPASALVVGAVGLTASPVPSEETLPEPTVTPGAVTLSPASVATEEALSAASLALGAVTLSPTPVPSEEAFGVPLIPQGLLAPAPVPSEEAFGVPTIGERDLFVPLVFIFRSSASLTLELKVRDPDVLTLRFKNT